MNLTQLQTELKEIWEGSGYSIKSMIKFLKDCNLFGWEEPFTDAYPIIFYGEVDNKHIVITITLSGYEILEKLKDI